MADSGQAARVALGTCAGLLAGLSLGVLLERRAAFGAASGQSESTALLRSIAGLASGALRARGRSSAGEEGGRGSPDAPPRPRHRALRPHADPRVDNAIFVRYDPSAERKTGAIIIVIPGGNYDESDVYCGEGQPIAQWLADNGITAVVLQYRCVSRGHYWPAQFDDWVECARVVRASAAEWGCDPGRVGVIGFSAGGHLASYAAARADPALRPGLQVLVYPAIDTLSPHDDGAIEPWDPSMGYPPPTTSTHLLVDENVPPTFIVGLQKDEYTPIQENADVYARVLSEYRVPVKYVQGEEDEHGCGLKSWWTQPCEEWLRSRGWACTK